MRVRVRENNLGNKLCPCRDRNTGISVCTEFLTDNRTHNCETLLKWTVKLCLMTQIPCYLINNMSTVTPTGMQPHHTLLHLHREIIHSSPSAYVQTIVEEVTFSSKGKRKQSN